ncbi:MAG: Gfo/Idh/MocA family oxidoreductase [Candidatus Handelsmanbacteria bacterium]|nr:Gfo/Idh/MocA family oxidoreductase [Candidatus Handelsmanbacteria bacterium]
MKVGVIGLGMGRAHLQAYKAFAQAEIVGIADLDESRLKASAAEYGIGHTFTDYHQLLALPELEAVSVCLPNHLHEPVTVDALRARKHVLVEKPMARTPAEARAMKEVAEASGKVLGISMNYRWIVGPDSWYLKHLIEQGRLGHIYYVRAYTLRRRTFPRGHKTWFTQKALSGGAALMDMGPHLLDLAMWLAGDYRPKQVSGTTRTALMTDTDVDDFGVVLVRMAGGAAIYLESTWASFTRPGVGLVVMGTEGGAILDLSAPQGKRLTVMGAEGETHQEITPVDIQLPFTPEASIQEHFIRRVAAGQQPETTAERGLAVVQVIDGAYRSSQSGHEVVIE